MRKYLLNLPAEPGQVPKDPMIGFRILTAPKGERVNWLKSVCLPRSLALSIGGHVKSNQLFIKTKLFFSFNT